jgi:hypothetical protein
MAKWQKTGGRIKGTPNKVTSAARSAFMATFGRIEGELEEWIRRGANGEMVPLMRRGEPVLDDRGLPVMVRMGADPLKAAAIIAQMAEYHFPKLGRTELVGDGGSPIQVQIVKFEDP